jgi:hypothetical protein
VAGPAGLAADVRKALRSGFAGPKAVLKGGPDVTLHVETYGIAVSAPNRSYFMGTTLIDPGGTIVSGYDKM